jgi:hypothetical protein
MRSSVLVGFATAFLFAPGSLSSQEIAPEAFRARHITLDLGIAYADQGLSGSITYELENWTTRTASDVSFLLGRLMLTSRVLDAAGNPLRYAQDVVRFRDTPLRQVTQLQVHLPRPVPPGGRTTLRIDYAGNLVGYTEIGWLYVRDHIDTAFTIIRSDALAFPVVGGLSDAANRKVPEVDFTYDASIRVPSRYLVATGGALTRAPHADGTTTWRYTSGKPSPFLDVSIAPFDTLSEGRVRVFYFPADSAGARRLMTGAQSALRTLTQWFGPLHSELNLAITEIPDGWGSQASPVGGIIQTAAAFRDARRLGELYHELSHLWNAHDTDSPSPRWQEGLASFLEDLLRERLDGWTGRVKSDSGLIARVKTRMATDTSLRTVPFSDYGKRGMTGHSYSVGDIMFATLYDLVGEAEFNKIVGGYYQQFANGGSTRDFVAFARRNASPDLTAFFDDWMWTPRWSAVLMTATSVRGLVDRYRTKSPAQSSTNNGASLRGGEQGFDRPAHWGRHGNVDTSQSPIPFRGSQGRVSQSL